MWKKKEPEPVPTKPTSPPPPARQPQPRAEARPETVALIGPRVSVKGELSGQEHLRIQGRVEGKVSLRGQDVTVGKSGRVQADIHARSIRVEGEVIGDLYGEQQILIEASGRVKGNLISPRVVLENGSRFKGSIDMESAAQLTQVRPSPQKPGSGTETDSKTASPGAARQPTPAEDSKPRLDPSSRS